jgi:hypothetical protein
MVVWLCSQKLELGQDLNHAECVEAAVLLQVPAHAMPLRVGRLAVSHAQKFAAGGAALLNRQPFVASHILTRERVFTSCEELSWADFG